MLKKVSFGLLAMAVLSMSLPSCKSDSARDEAVSAAAGNTGGAGDVTLTGNTTPVTPEASAAQPAPPVGPTTTVQFAETEFNFGKVKAGEKVQHDYTFTNTGKEPLVISNAKGSCGCTVPEWPKDPIAPGATGKIKVEFDSKGKAGAQAKQVTITANTNPATSILTIKGEVIGDAPQPATAVQTN
ncbi:MAG: hypothetical protein RLY31_2519 [Bacteroidota bacterium]